MWGRSKDSKLPANVIFDLDLMPPSFYLQVIHDHAMKYPVVLEVRHLKKVTHWPGSIFCQQKVEKNTSKSSILKQKFRCFKNLPFTALQPKWQNSCSKMWPIEQLYIELGLPCKNQCAASSAVLPKGFLR